MIDQIEHLVEAGFALHWLKPRSKSPFAENWSDKPVASLKALRASYRDGYNVGVRLGKWSKVGGAYLHVIDYDINDPDLADEAESALREMFPGYEEFPTVKSGSGGKSRHFYILCDQPLYSRRLARSKEKIEIDGKLYDAWQIDLFGTGKQVVLPPSIHPDTLKPYRWLKEFDPTDLEMDFHPVISHEVLDDLIEPGAAPLAPDDERLKPIGLTLEQAKDVLDDLPQADWLHDRDGWYKVGMALHHEFGGSEEAYKLWVDFSRQSTKFDKSDQRRVWLSFKNKQKRRPVRMATLMAVAQESRLEADVEDLGDGIDDLDATSDEDGDDEAVEEQDDVLASDGPSTKPAASKAEQRLKKAELEAAMGHVPAKIARLNKKHAIAFVSGRAIIITENDDEDRSVSYGPVSDLHTWFENDRVKKPDGKTEPLSKAWLRHKMRREFPNGIVFEPGREINGAYNHWRGFTVEPVDDNAGCKLWLRHLKRVICNNNEEHYRYALGWFAHMIQKPQDKPGVAMVLRGLKGAGKDIIADYVGSLFKHHHIKIANQDQLVGKFNAHQERCLLLHVEEGYWAGSKAAEGSLKHIITSSSVTIERKGIDAFKVRSFLRIFISSNEQWVVPASADERRYFVLDVPATHKGDRDYFTALVAEMNGGGRAALLHYLLNYDLSEFEVRDVPETEALGEQKLQGLRGFEKWWYEILERGEFPMPVYSYNQSLKGKEGRGADWENEWVYCNVDDMRDAYTAWTRIHRYEAEPDNERSVGKKLKMMCPSADRVRKRSGGKENDQRFYVYNFPALAEARHEFEKYLKSKVVWSD